MELSRMEKRMLYQMEGSDRYAVLNELSMAFMALEFFNPEVLIWLYSGNGISAKYAILRKIALLANLCNSG